jgi:hypothetical protein
MDLESRGGWNELMAHKLIEETLNAQVAWRNPKCKNLPRKPSCVVKPTRTNLLFLSTFGTWGLPFISYASNGLLVKGLLHD